MKHSMKIISIEIGIIIVALLSLLLFSINYYLYLCLISVLAMILYFILKPERKIERFHIEIFLITVILVLFYYAITYFLGFIVGFYYTTYSRSIFGILRNIVCASVLIIAIESIRETLIKNNAYHKSIVWITPILCFLLELPSIINLKIYTSKVDLFTVFLMFLLPSFIKNIVLTYIVYKSGKMNSIVYQFLMTIPNYLLPVFPNLGDFFTIIFSVSLPIILMVFIMNISTVKFEKVTNSRKIRQDRIILNVTSAIMVFIIVVIVYLTSNVFRFASLAIGSGSMTGSINKGDVVILDKKDKRVTKGDVIAFQQQGKVIVHRIVNVKVKSNNKYYETKGDANKDKDGWLVTKNNLVGKVKLRIPLLGWPTIALSELLS